mgnify:CR=1 FL=1
MLLRILDEAAADPNPITFHAERIQRLIGSEHQDFLEFIIKIRDIKNKDSLTGEYISGKKKIEIKKNGSMDSNESIKISIRFLSNEIRSDSLKIIVHKQAMMRGLCKRLVEAETGGKVKRISFKG